VDPQKFELPLQVKAIEELIAQRVTASLSPRWTTPARPRHRGSNPRRDSRSSLSTRRHRRRRPHLHRHGHKTAGYEAGKKMAELMKGKGSIAILQEGSGPRT